MRKFKVNKVSVDLQKYLYYIRGIRKSGKTTLFRDLVLELFKTPEKGLLVAFKDEVGYLALDELQAEHVETWKDFEQLVKDLVKDKKENGVEFIGLDTADEMVDSAIQYAIKLSALETGKPCKTLNSAWGGYGAGRQRVTEMIKEQLALLRKAGYGIVVLGHTKLRTIKEKGMTDDEGYQQLTSNLSSDYDGIFADVFDVIATIDVEKSVEDKHLVDSVRYMYFRNNGFIDAGSRFKGLPERIKLEGDNIAKPFIEAIEQGIRSSMTNPISDEEIKVQREQETKERETKAEEFVKDTTMDNEEMIAKIKDAFIDSNDKTKKAVMDYMTDIKVTTFQDASKFTGEQLKNILDILKS